MRELKIACGNSRQSKFWSNKTVSFEELCRMLRTPARTPETSEEYMNLPKPQRDAIKDRGGFVAGHLRDNRRKADHVECRSMLVYDLDFATPEFVRGIKGKIPYKGCVYSTHSHTPDAPRVRVVLPALRDMTPDEHNAVARFTAQDSGILGMVDPCSFEPAQLMYWPSCPSDGEYLFVELEGDLVDPDKVLAAHPGWTNCSSLPVSPKENKVKPTSGKHQKDPLTKEGAVGLFCRLYSVNDAIDKFLSDVYEPVTNAPGRYTYIPGESTAGLVVYNNGTYAYSHHATDPASGKLLNAFDLVRVHRFPDADPKQSFKKMADFVMGLPDVRILATKDRMAKAGEDFRDADEEDSWLSLLEYNPGGTIVNSLQNILLILENDPVLKGIVFNQMSDSIEVKSPVPWKHPSKSWRDADDAQLISYINAKFGRFSQNNFQIGLTKVTDDRSYHPVREYFDRLPWWDGVVRAESLFIDYLGAEDNEYVRAVTRKLLCAAYERIFHPGIKFDFCLVLNGPQGIGKSTIIEKLGMQWYSDSLSMSDTNDKTAAEKLQGFWILEIGELAGMKKADLEKVKAFISRTDDKYRASFGRRVTSHPRQCVFIGTTNSETGYLRDITGNRRFWNVRVTGGSMAHPWDLTQDIIDQVWAEVREIADDEELKLPPELEEFARKEQNAAMEHDEREGLVADYLDTLLPSNWDEMDFYARRNFIRDKDDPTSPKGTELRESVSNIEIWCECFGKQKEELRPADSYAITAIMMRMPGWERTDERPRHKIYGQQRVYRRVRRDQ